MNLYKKDNFMIANQKQIKNHLINSFGKLIQANFVKKCHLIILLIHQYLKKLNYIDI